jgi:hypothetical protein
LNEEKKYERKKEKLCAIGKKNMREKKTKKIEKK